MDSVNTDKKMNQPADEGVMQSFSPKKTAKKSNMKIVGTFILVVLFGLGSGYVLASRNSSSDNSGSNVSMMGAEKGKIFGAKSTKGFDNPAEGIIKEGGIEGEGAFHMERPGGDDQTVYLTSSSVDIGKFINKKVRVWGKSQDAQHAGWLLDVGRLEVL
jgi:hypothetical protein